VEFGLPDLEGRTHILRIHAKVMSVDRDIRYELLARLCPNTTGDHLFILLFTISCLCTRTRKSYYDYSILSLQYHSNMHGILLGAELRSVCTEAGMFSIRSRRKSVSEKDFLDSITKVTQSTTPSSYITWHVSSNLGHQRLPEVLIYSQVHGLQLNMFKCW